MSILNVLCLKRTGSAIAVGLLAGLLNAVGFAQVQVAPAATPEVIIPKIVIVEGEAGVNAIKEEIAAKPVVEVRDQYDLPIAGASVEFALPKNGPGGVFAHGAKSVLTVVADSHGRASMDGVRLNGKGSFQVFVTAEYKGHTSTTAIAQTNFADSAAAQKAGKTPGTSASSTVKLPAGAMAFSGGGVATTLVVVGAAAAGAAYYFLLKGKTPIVGTCAPNLLSNFTTALTNATTVCDDDGSNCQTDISILNAAAQAVCDSGCSGLQSYVSALGAVQQYFGGVQVSASCLN